MIRYGDLSRSAALVLLAARDVGRDPTFRSTLVDLVGQGTVTTGIRDLTESGVLYPVHDIDEAPREPIVWLLDGVPFIVSDLPCMVDLATRSSGVYEWWDADGPVYVGSSQCIRSRLQAHWRDWARSESDSLVVTWHVTRDYRAVEAGRIRELQPRRNRAGL